MVTITNMSKSFDNGKNYALRNVSFTLIQGKSYGIVGESGSGKTTLIRLLCGLETPCAGTILVNGTVVTSNTVFMPPEKRKIGLVFQDYALFPHLSVYENIVYGIAKKSDRNKRVSEVLNLVGLNGLEKRYPHELSGGQQQRVALARALAPKPTVLILDEPFSNLDASLRTQLRNELFSIIKKTNTTAIFVTHDTEDALAVADEILVLKNGILLQKNSAQELYLSPNSYYVASLFGNVITLDNDSLKMFGINEASCISIRQEDIQLNSNTEFSAQAQVIRSKFMGEKYQLELSIADKVLLVNHITSLETKNCTIGFNKNNIMYFSAS